MNQFSKITLAVMLTFSFIFTSPLMAQVGPSDGGCWVNVVKNHGFENGGAMGNDLLNNATSWKSIFTAASRADYLGQGATLPASLTAPTTIPTNLTKWAGFWSRRNCSQLAYREGLAGELNTTLASNSGNYRVSFLLACGHFGAGASNHKLNVYAISSSTVIPATNTSANCQQSNTNIFSGLTLLASINVNNATTTFQNYSAMFNMAGKPAFDRFLITSDDGVVGMKYFYIDNVTISKYSIPCPE